MDMNIDAFAEWVQSTWNYGDNELKDKFIMTVGLGGEVGEVLEILKKAERDEGRFDRQDLIEELGDVLHYWCMIVKHNNLSIQEIINANILKLTERRQRKAKKKAALLNEVTN